VGFPGETERDFRGTLALVEEVRFESSFCFSYSPRPGTRALRLEEDDVPEAQRAERLARLLRVQEDVRRARNRRWLGRQVDVLVERANPRVAGEVEGRASTHHPVHFAGPLDELRGKMVRVLVERTGSHALGGTMA
jgi:tRNA-2-methylthio-N6-dimethylallyladenosine synthase